MSSTEKSAAINGKEMTIIEEPRPSDCLLGQGHYRHPGNVRLNEIVDSKVLEYKAALRPFKTYMVHEIVQKLRKKDGVRFLKELKPKGWVVVNDDKEAREKISQRFQYSMRKLAENSSTVEDNSISANKSLQPTETVPVPQPNLVWKGTTVRVPFLPVFHQLQKTSVMVDDDINEVSKRLMECFQIIGVQEVFNHEEANAKLTISENNLKMQMHLFKPLGTGGVIVELVNLSGDAMTFQRNSRYILESATGLFDRYKHTLCQSRKLTTSTVQDHVTTFSSSTTNQLPSNANSNKKPSAKGNGFETEVTDSKRGGLPVFSDRHVQQESKPQKPRRESIPTTICIKRDRIPAFNEGAVFGKHTYQVEGTGKKTFVAKEQDYLKRPSPKRVEAKSSFVPLIDKPYDHDAGPLHSSDSMLGRFDEARAAFSRWDTGVNRLAKTPTTAQRKGHADSSSRKITVPDKVTSNNDIRTGVDLYQLKHPAATKWSKAQTTTHKEEKLSIKGDNYTKPLDALPNKQNTAEAEGNFGANNDAEKWAEASAMEQMKCCSGIDEGPFQTRSPMEVNTDSIRLLSLTGGEHANQAPRNNADIYEPIPISQWAEALANQDMKCDNSFDDDDPFTDYSASPKRSWIPSTFFGVPPPCSQQANLKIRSPPSPAGSFCSHISVEMRSQPSPSPSQGSHFSVEVYSLPSPCNSFNSKCSLAKNSLSSTRMDEAPSPSMFNSDQSEEGEQRAFQPGPLLTHDYTQSYPEGCDVPMLGASPLPDVAAPPVNTIFADSSSIGSAA